ncbi:MAG: DUF441 domain-containing protein [Heliobacteriaceae bacterium]|nr:DUF441 domain-containing protein [Heliobacteriaceae bacterium]MDD4588654.1 DUF441 domain-containing protein [Heliobacteriaceae bacterium]
MRGGLLLLFIVVILGLFARSPLTTVAALCVLIFAQLGWQDSLVWIERRGVELGLFFLILAMLAPFATGKVNWREVTTAFGSLPGILALVCGVLATHLNGRGIDLLTVQPQLIVGMIAGSLLGIIFFGGVPVGPLMAGGLTAFFLQVFNLLSR